jgi:CheY-like chemotaxis protein
MAATALAVDQRRLSGAHVLVVDDDADVRQCAVDVFQLEGASVSEASSGDAAFDLFRLRPPEVIVSDLWMPDGSGFDLIRRVRALTPEHGGLTPAIAVSAAENSGKALMAGFHVFLAKPFELEALVETVADFVRGGAEHAVAPWTLTRDGERLTLTFAGRIEAGDIRAMISALILHLDQGPVDLVCDLRGGTGFAPSVASVGERAIWTRRRRIRSLRVVGGSFAARLVSAAACKVLSIPCSFAESLDGSDRAQP